MDYFQRLMNRIKNYPSQIAGSHYCTNSQIINDFVHNPLNPFLISFPRTGSHWLRMLMELYFERPSLKRIFYYPDNRDYLTLHTHDLNLEVVRKNVIYLYRNPIDTVYSQLNYHKEDLNSEERVFHWSELYGKHLSKWLYWEDFTDNKSVIKYDRLKTDFFIEFNKINKHFNLPFDKERLEQVSNIVTKKEVKSKTIHDPQVIHLEKIYESNKVLFKKKWESNIWQIVLQNREFLSELMV